MTTGEYELPPHLARYLDSLSDPGCGRRRRSPPEDHCRVPRGPVPHRPRGPVAAAVPPAIALPDPGAPSAIQADGHVDPADAARWHQAQAELAALIRAENRLSADAGLVALLPASLTEWMENRVAELEQAEASQPEPS